jgi:hypothetical protein
MRYATMLCLILLTPLPAARAGAQADLRARVALSCLQLELALAQAPELQPAERIRINREFVRTTLRFFGGNTEAALAVIDSLVASVAPAGPGEEGLEVVLDDRIELGGRGLTPAIDGAVPRAGEGSRDLR